jgi:hypothetical protein
MQFLHTLNGCRQIRAGLPLRYDVSQGDMDTIYGRAVALAVPVFVLAIALEFVSWNSSSTASGEPTTTTWPTPSTA